MNIYKIKQNANKDYDTYDSAVVIAESESKAQQMQPEQNEQYLIPDSREFKWQTEEYFSPDSEGYFSLDNREFKWQEEEYFISDSREFNWAAPEDVIVTYIGKADPSFTEPCVIVSSYNAG